ncbi:Zinc metalloproteinase [Aquicella siphonis]|uniref:Neutral metalloproteinase n=1 Tax=Aquicella siphonis TaxID=254247 RepID=A0A5E4PJR3_9COXI|nr:M4 family metallopeptidase [Aquicella siphonis]VVC76653.1 Zinc metalloproteinase [Aquicella siphonis]
MENNQRRLVLSGMLLLGLPLFCGVSAYAAKPVDLRHQNITALQSLISTPTAARGAAAIKEISRHVDFKNTLHVRIQQTYSGYNVWGADAVVHIPNGEKTSRTLSGVASAAKNNGTMNGTVYQDLNVDLAGAPAEIFTQTHAQTALQKAIENYQHKIGNKANVSEQESSLMVFVGSDNKARWAYKVSFRAEAARSDEKPSKPVSIMDATTFQVYASWDDIKTLEKMDVDGGGFGGNKKMGKLIYDGTQNHLAKLMITRDTDANTCFLQNSDVTVKDYNGRKVMTFPCAVTSNEHNNVYWDADFDAVNDGYSPGNDAFFGGQVIKHMYKDWYGMPVLTNPDGTPMMLNMVVHQRNYDNAYWDGRQMTFGDGYTMFYPLTSLGVAAHEISHGFTEQHSGLMYYGQSGGMNEAFSDMAAQAAEVYAYGPNNNSWQIGPEIFKAENEALRYMDKPSKDCKGKKPGTRCSIDDASQYTDWIDVHYSSGVYNRFFYTLGTSQGWDAKKAFDVMVHANSSYWTSSATFSEAACGVISAASDLKYDVAAVKAAFDVVKVDYSAC